MDYLVFRLYGPMASWGQAAVGGERPTGMAPGRAAILGLIGAAMGIEREDDAGQQQLFDELQIAVKQLSAGTLMRDYQTVQAPSTDKKHRHFTRKSELSVDKLNTVLSSRHYRQDGIWIVAVYLKDGAQNLTLKQIQEYFKRPVFPLYLGRKSCPPALPLMPTLVTTDSLKQALDTKFPDVTATTLEVEEERSGKGKSTWSADKYCLALKGQSTYYWQGELNGLDGTEHDATLTYHPWDDPISRTRWQFGQRQQHQLTLMEER
ncbi:type I-E CRISPR-associated protein Cas5/CasD [Oceanobacter kriegii]|uniref:type I-E CRISPR-associated protein Cas5/CasD n=1 Tax=Oceanobacter kriegii TaxID=64972 RepID=UPI0005698FF5|nr:type I-E CRISPR-associated protein Cas5/CasD [Oceanobacter kriegii]